MGGFGAGLHGDRVAVGGDALAVAEDWVVVDDSIAGVCRHFDGKLTCAERCVDGVNQHAFGGETCTAGKNCGRVIADLASAFDDDHFGFR